MTVLLEKSEHKRVLFDIFERSEAGCIDTETFFKFAYFDIWMFNSFGEKVNAISIWKKGLWEKSIIHRNFIVNIDRIVNKMYSCHRAVNIFVVLRNCSVLFCAKEEENYTIADNFVSKNIMVDNRQVQNITFDDIKKAF